MNAEAPLPAPATPDLSVVVALISGRRADLERCLESLRGQVGVAPFETLVPYDPPCADVVTLAAKFPDVKFIPWKGPDTRAARAGASREHHDALRTLGLREANGRIVILIEDHARAAPNFCAALVAALDAHPLAGCVGGAVEFGGGGLLAFAVYLCDFGRYGGPLPDGPARFVSDSCVAYRKLALVAVAQAWRDDYHEMIVHDAMRWRGLECRLTPGVAVTQDRRGLSLGAALRERRVWGRSYAGSRVARAGALRRLAFAAGTPFLPFLLTWRRVREAFKRGQSVGRTLFALPLLLLLNEAWSLGELIGYVSGAPHGSRSLALS
jgi:hypothetical protein